MKMLTEAEYNSLVARAKIGNAAAKALAAPGADALVDRLIAAARSRPYTDIHHLGSLYMERGWLLEKPDTDADACGVRLHRIVRSDVDRHLHDHPGWSLSVVLAGGYFEELPQDPRADMARWDGGQERTYLLWRAPGDIVYREAADRHRIVLPEGREALSLFVIGPTVHKWGFYTQAGKVAWEDYLGVAKQPAIGAGQE